ncbi:MAG TPA: shikimate dehydrogenase [Beijerinckiaceae bacterium]|jgi:shikimate dehydrogenase
MVLSIPKAFVVGHPIRHSRSPLIHGHWLKEHGLAGAYERVEVAPEDFEAFFRGFPEQFRGGNVTIPHKEAAFRLADATTERARRLEAVNTLWVEDGRIHGDNTDVTGFVASLDQALGAWSAGTALVLGAGGASRGVIAGLLDRVERIVVANRTDGKARELVRLAPGRIEPAAWSEIPRHLPRAGLLVNTTSCGMAGHPPLEIDLSGLPGDAVVTDIVYVPLETPLLAQARARGLRAVGGLGMLLHQAVPGFERWFGVRPAVTPELRALIEADILAR